MPDGQFASLSIDSGEESALFGTEEPYEGAGITHIVAAVFGLGLLCKVGGAGVYFTEQMTVTVEKSKPTGILVEMYTLDSRSLDDL